MLKVAYEIIRDFGSLGIGIVQLGVICLLFWKLFTNHLKHITIQIQEVDSKVHDVQKEITPIKERISKIEGMLD